MNFHYAARIIFEKPCPAIGPPLSIDWEPISQSNVITENQTRYEDIYDVEEYERNRPRRKVTYRRPGHHGPSWIFLIVSAVKREEILDRLGVDKKQIRAAVREVNRVKFNRWLSLKWYFNPIRTVKEFPSNVYLLYRSSFASRRRARIIKTYYRKWMVPPTDHNGKRRISVTCPIFTVFVLLMLRSRS